MNKLSEFPDVVVRNLRPSDMDAIVRIDAKITGRRRQQYFELKLAQALSDTGIVVSLAAEYDGRLAGFLMARVYYGEFGSTEQVAVLDTLAVDPDCTRHGAASSLVRQLRTNLLGLGVCTLRTEVAWDDQQLLTFLHHAGFQPAPRICLEQDLQAALATEGELEAAGLC